MCILRGGCARVITHHYHCARAPTLRVCSAQPSSTPDLDPYQLAVHIMASPLVMRPRTSPTCSTSIRPHKRRYLRELAENENLLAPRRKLLTPTLEAESEAESSKGPGNWDHQEVKALVIFILFHCKGDSWPCHKRMEV